MGDLGEREEMMSKGLLNTLNNKEEEEEKKKKKKTLSTTPRELNNK